jgi:hypothetical protein
VPLADFGHCIAKGRILEFEFHGARQGLAYFSSFTPADSAYDVVAGCGAGFSTTGLSADSACDPAGCAGGPSAVTLVRVESADDPAGVSSAAELFQ